MGRHHQEVTQGNPTKSDRLTRPVTGRPSSIFDSTIGWWCLDGLVNDACYTGEEREAEVGSMNENAARARRDLELALAACWCPLPFPPEKATPTTVSCGAAGAMHAVSAPALGRWTMWGDAHSARRSAQANPSAARVDRLPAARVLAIFSGRHPHRAVARIGSSSRGLGSAAARSAASRGALRRTLTAPPRSETLDLRPKPIDTRSPVAVNTTAAKAGPRSSKLPTRRVAEFPSLGNY
jgi:hypothetical protein